MGGFAVVEDFEGGAHREALDRVGGGDGAGHYSRAGSCAGGVGEYLAVYRQIRAKQAKGQTPPFLVGWDSIGSCPADAADLATSGSDRPARVAAVMSTELRKMYKRIWQVRAHILFVNQCGPRLARVFSRCWSRPGVMRADVRLHTPGGMPGVGGAQDSA